MKNVEQIQEELSRRIKVMQEIKEILNKNGLPSLSEIESHTEVYNNILKFITSK